MAEFYFIFFLFIYFLNDNRILLKEIEQYKRTKLNSHQHKPPNDQTKTEQKSGKKHIGRSSRIGRRLNQTIRLRMGASYHKKERCFKCIAQINQFLHHIHQGPRNQTGTRTHQTAKEYPSRTMPLRFHQQASERSTWIASISALLTKQTPIGPKEKKILEPQLARIIPSMPTRPGLPMVLPSKLSLQMFVGRGFEDGSYRSVRLLHSNYSI